MLGAKRAYTLCNEAINTKDSVCAGNILVHNEHTYFIEYFYGPGTPRDIESKGPDELKTYSKSLGQPAQGERPPEEVLRMVLDARRFQPLNKAYIIEFSVYPYPVGKSRDYVVCWEWRWGWLHYQLQANQFLQLELKNAQEANKGLGATIKSLRSEVAYLRGRLQDPDSDRASLPINLPVVQKRP